MGTKHALAPIVAGVARLRPNGPFLDAFAGMCSVAKHVQTERSVWTNDLQCFAVTAAKSMLCDRSNGTVGLDRFHARYRQHFAALSNRFRTPLRIERLMLAAPTIGDFVQRFELLEASIDRRVTRQFDLFSTIYANTYVGLEQAIEIDSLIFSLTHAIECGEVSEATRRKFLFALGRTLLRISTTTGHFAQFQTPSAKNWKRFQRTRRISVIDFFETDYARADNHETLYPERNRAFNIDAISLLRALRRADTKPSIVYADPPYKQDQYSRYYHLLETLVLYDYPRTSGKAKYREGRPTSIFSSKAKSYRGITALSALTSSMGANFILSYPEDGIADIRRDEMVKLLNCHFRKVEIAHEGLLRHSTMGASKGSATQPVIERIYLGQN